MRALSPFPHKIKLPNPNERIRWGDITDPDLIAYYKRVSPVDFNPLVRDYKKNIVNHWCNMMFTPRGWDFEEEWDNDASDDISHEYWLCFKKESDATFFALKWA